MALHDNKRVVCGCQADSPPPGPGARRWFYHRVFRLLTWLHTLVLTVAKFLGSPRSRPRTKGYEILLTGRFESDNWVLSLLGPLAASKKCRRVWVVSTFSMSPIPKVTVVRPPPWLEAIVGSMAARLLTFVSVAFVRRPEFVGGFHLLINGLVAIALAPLVGARSLYVCVGGPVEALDGGVWQGDGNPFERMETPDAVVERRLLRAVNACDLVVTMGSSAKRFFRDKGVTTNVRVITGGIDSREFRPGSARPTVDVILTGRIVAIKRIDVFLEALREVVRKMPDVRAVVVGEGKLRKPLMKQARDLCIDRHIEFLGFQPSMSEWLRQSKVFVLTSDCEGLSLAMMEAMLCGLPAIVSDVGDLGDLVEDGVNGYLVPRRRPELFAERIIDLLKDEQTLTGFSHAARKAALRHETTRVTQKWDEVLASLSVNGCRGAKNNQAITEVASLMR